MDKDGQLITEVKKSIKKGECFITIKGEFTITHMDELLKLTNINLEKLSKIRIDANDISKIDVSGIQVIYFLVHEARKFNLQPDYSGPVQDEVCALLDQCGFDSLVK